MTESRTAIIAGASSGVGAVTALALADIGFDVALVARRREQLEDVGRQVRERGTNAYVLPADLQDGTAAERAMGEAVRRLGAVDVLVNCLGTNVTKRRLEEISISDWDHVVATNLSAILYSVRAVLPSMRKRGRGLIISISSIAGLQPSALSGAAYCASKAGLNALAACINLEEGEHGIRSCVICPGDIDTELPDRRPRPPTAQERARMLQPADVAGLVVSVVLQPEHARVDQIVVRPSDA
jgi:NADP-dependent 3-hydroxy acid dehydrogenase YdfG